MAIIYLIEAIKDYDDTVYKIGYTKSNKSKKDRIRNLQTGNDNKLNILYEFNTKYEFKLETALHNFLKHNNKRGEWFKLELTEVSNFIKICEQIEKNFDALKDNPFFNKKSDTF